MADRDHMAGIRAGVAAFEQIYEEHGTRPPPTKNSDGSIEIDLTGISHERVVEAIVAAYLAGSHS